MPASSRAHQLRPPVRANAERGAWGILGRFSVGALLATVFALLLAACSSGLPSSPVPSPTLAPPEVIARGEDIFQRTAGGRGCAACHGKDARGQVGPDIRGRSASDIRRALKSVDLMQFISLTDDEIEAVVAYLQFLKSR